MFQHTLKLNWWTHRHKYHYTHSKCFNTHQMTNTQTQIEVLPHTLTLTLTLTAEFVDLLLPIESTCIINSVIYLLYCHFNSKNVCIALSHNHTYICIVLLLYSTNICFTLSHIYCASTFTDNIQHTYLYLLVYQFDICITPIYVLYTFVVLLLS